MTEINNGIKFDFLDVNILPQLVIGIEAQGKNSQHPYQFKPEYNFLNIQHQTGGTICHQRYIQGKLLVVRSEFKPAVSMLSEKWLGTDIWSYPRLDTVLKYRQNIKDFFGKEADCNYSWTHFEEAIYPLDSYHSLLEKLSEDELPDDLDDMIDWDKMPGGPTTKSFEFIHRWNLWILGENSD